MWDTEELVNRHLAVKLMDLGPTQCRVAEVSRH